MGFDNLALTRNDERSTFENEDPASSRAIVERKMSMATSILVLMVGIHEMQDQEVAQGHRPSGLDQMLLIMIGECGDT